MINSRIYDNHFGTRVGAGVTSRGQLVVSPLEYNEPYFQSMVTINTAFNFIGPVTGKRFVIDGLFISSDKNVSATNGAVINIYEADAPDSIVSTKDIFTLDIGKLETSSLTALNVITSEGIWVNAKTDDATTNVTLLGYYVKV
jgi:hypothetical protein